jgi:membrane protein DedA with SNARE-associated domain
MPELSDSLTQWIATYGGIALFFLLACGILGLPIPDEPILVIAGWLVAKGDLLLLPTLISAILGSCCGITLSYLLGITAGKFLVEKYGYWIGITHYRVQRARRWFERVGKWALLIGYFIPLMRHLTGYTAGTSSLTFRIFALHAYAGALLWATTFLLLGYFFGERVLSFTF